MDDFVKRVTSRKFLAYVAAILTAVSGLLTDHLTFLQFVAAVVVAGIGYQAAEGYVDGQAARAGDTVVVHAPTEPPATA